MKKNDGLFMAKYDLLLMYLKKKTKTMRLYYVTAETLKTALLVDRNT